MLCHAVTSFSNGLGEVLALKPAEQCLAAEFNLLCGTFLRDFSSDPLKVS